MTSSSKYSFNTLDLYLVSARVEGGPRSIFEASMSKTPIISTDVGVASELLPKESIYDMNDFLTYKNALPNIDKSYNNTIINYNKFPYTEEEFNKYFISNGKFVKQSFFKNKIVGYVSYVGDKRELMPSIEVPTEKDLTDKYYKDSEIFVEEIPMTKHVLYGYNYARTIEKDMDSALKKSNKWG